MATSGTSSFKVHRRSRGFRSVLASAVLEWLLIFLLFIDAIFSYLVTKFARYCELQIPCLLCSRLDHVLGNEKPGFYRNLICGDHKLEISSLVLCRIHDKLADVHGLCEACLFSFVTENRSNVETYRLLVGKLGWDPERCVDEDTECCLDENPLLDEDLERCTGDSYRTRSCSCCKNPWTMRSPACRFPQAKLIAPEVGELDAPSLDSKADNHFRNQRGMQKRREKPSGLVLVRASHRKSGSIDPLCHIGYSELKITSDAESEFPFSDDDDASALACEPFDLKEDYLLLKNASDDLTLEKMIHEASTSEPSVLISSVQLEVDKPLDVTSSAPDVAIGHGLEELNWHQVEHKVTPSAPCELISLDDVPASTCVAEAPIEVLGDNLDAMGTSDTGYASTKESGEAYKLGSGLSTTTGLVLKTDQVSNDPTPLVLDSLSDAYELAVLDKGSTASALLAEQLSGKDSAIVSQDLKPLLSQISAVHGLELSVNDMSPKVHGNGDELKTSDSSSSIGMQTLQKKISLEINESGFEVLGDNLDAMGTSDTGYASTKESGEAYKLGSGLSTTTGMVLKTDQVSNDPTPLVLDSLSDAYELAVLDKGSTASALLAEQLSGEDGAIVSQDLKPLLSQISAVHGLELSVNDMSPKVHGNGDELKTSDSSSSIGMQTLQKKISLEINESGFESLNGSIVGEIEGESVVERLKRQVEYYRKSMSALYKELEEERNAAVVAANQAVAMINRLEEEKVNPPARREHILLDDVPASACATEASIEVPGDNSDAMGTSDTAHTSVEGSGEVCKPGSGSTTTTGLDLKTDEVSNDPTPVVLDSLSDAYKLAVLGKGSQASALLAEQLSGKDSAKVSEDLKLLLSQISAVRGLELSVNDMNSKVHENGDELKTSESSSSIGVQILQKKISLERNESGFESLDESIVSEIEGESVVDRLKRQVEYDRKSMSALYKELEEERNAAAVAANQALAMITRLQEEKAALHMEALQYLRMMEEQAEYDVEALQKANDLLAEREKDIQDLEAELEFYRASFPDESMLEKIQEVTCDLRGVDRIVEGSDVSGIEANANTPHYPPITRHSESGDKPGETNHANILKSSVLEFEDERLYISQCLKKLEKRLQLFSNNGVYVELSNGGYSNTHDVNDLDGIYQNELTQGTSQLGDNDFPLQNGVPLSEGNPPAEERHNTPVGDLLSDDKEKHHVDCDRKDSSIDGGVNSLDALGNEVLDLNERLRALEADKNFLEHAINSLRNGDEGSKFIQEIAHHLRELRKIGIRRREQAIA